MATQLNVVFCSDKPLVERGHPIPRPDYSTSEDIALTASPAASAASATVKHGMVRLIADVAARVEIGASPSVEADGAYLAAGVTYFFPVATGDSISARTA